MYPKILATMVNIFELWWLEKERILGAIKEKIISRTVNK